MSAHEVRVPPFQWCRARGDPVGLRPSKWAWAYSMASGEPRAHVVSHLMEVAPRHIRPEATLKTFDGFLNAKTEGAKGLMIRVALRAKLNQPRQQLFERQDARPLISCVPHIVM